MKSGAAHTTKTNGGLTMADVMVAEIDYVDPLAADAARLIADRSNAGALVYGECSILDKGQTAGELLTDAIEECADQLLYLLALRSKLRES